jgi:hypothetical protein
MTVQRLHKSLAPLDILTREEMQTLQDHQLDAAIRERYRGLDTARFPQLTLQGNGGTLNLAASGSENNVGPEQGDVWMVRRVLVVSSNFANDSAKYVLFRSSTPSDSIGAFQPRYLLDGMAFSAVTTMATPAVPPSTVGVINTTNQNYTVVVSGGTVSLVNIGGLTNAGTGDGTYIVPPGQSITLTYSVAPTWTWTPTSVSQLGQYQGIAYNAGNKALLLQPGEQIYAQVYGTSATAMYTLTGEAIRVPAEMKGKVVG